MNRELIYDILRLALMEDAAADAACVQSGVSVLADASAQDWNWAFNTLSMHGLAAFAYVLCFPPGKAV